MCTCASSQEARSRACTRLEFLEQEIDMDHTFETGAEIEGFLRSEGLTDASTGGGYSGWFLELQGQSGPWQIMISDWTTDSTNLQPGKPIGIALYAPGGVETQAEVLPNADGLRDALKRFKDAGVQQFGTA
ncbi:hypothetical protein GA566_30955 [Cupriavidus sp. SW-Y-13]|nr:hypothetical protein [Cupriavidus sp. SW-Y-13]